MRQTLSAQVYSGLHPRADGEVILEEVNQRRFCFPGEVGTWAEKAAGRGGAHPRRRRCAVPARPA